jgi:hypothetical protein
MKGDADGDRLVTKPRERLRLKASDHDCPVLALEREAAARFQQHSPGLRHGERSRTRPLLRDRLKENRAEGASLEGGVGFRGRFLVEHLVGLRAGVGTRVAGVRARGLRITGWQVPTGEQRLLEFALRQRM